MLEKINNFINIDRSCCVVLEEILRNNHISVQKLGEVNVSEAVLVGAWYIWWQRREFVKGETIATPTQSAFSIAGLALNYKGAHLDKLPKQVRWSGCGGPLLFPARRRPGAGWRGDERCGQAAAVWFGGASLTMRVV